MECSFCSLIALLIRYDRKSIIERLLMKNEWRRHDVMRTGIYRAIKTSNAKYAHYFFERISRRDLEQFEYTVFVQGMSGYLLDIALESNTSSSVLEKIYCWYFCDSTGMFCMNDLYEVVESTYKCLDIDFMYDCMARRCPRYYNFMKFHKLFLELALRDKIMVRNDALVMINLLAHSIDMNPNYIVLGRKPIKLNRQNTSEKLQKELLNAIKEVKRLDLVYKVSFNEYEYTTFLSRYAADFANSDSQHKHKCKSRHRGFGEVYNMEIIRIFGEK
eukprot:jgi/Antlo1/2466/432